VLKVGARVAVPDYTFVGTLQAVLEAHCRPVLLPTNPETWTIDPLALRRYRAHYDAAIVVSPFGYYVDVPFYDDLAASLGIDLVYDFAGAWGMFPRTRYPVTYSLHATKNFACGDGGLVSFETAEGWETAFKLHNFGFTDGRPHTLLAGNHKIDEFRSAQILAHLAAPERINAKIAHKITLISRYQEGLRAAPVSLHVRGAPSLCVVSGVDARKIERLSDKLGFKAKQYYHPLTRVETFAKVPRYGRFSPCFLNHLALPSDVSGREVDHILKRVLSLT